VILRYHGDKKTLFAMTPRGLTLVVISPIDKYPFFGYIPICNQLQLGAFVHHTEFLNDLRQAGHRLTPQREMILQVICESHAHLTADDIIARVRQRYPYLNKSAVYRTLDLLVQIGIVNPTDFGQGCVTYEIHRDPHHHHLVCRRCGKMSEVDADVFAPVEKKLRDQYAFSPDLDHFAIFGLCRKCQRSGVKGQGSGIRKSPTSNL
jgi:Fur family ferric uptake transcriptional regulator